METINSEYLSYKREKKSDLFPKKVIVEIVKQIESGQTLKEASSAYDVSYNTINRWMKHYASEDYIFKTVRLYKPSEKRSVVRAVESGMSVREATTVFGINSTTVVRSWLKQLNAENHELSGTMAIPKPQTDILKNQDIKALQQQLAESELKVRALETMIDIAEEQLKIDIRKKSGAKQSPK